MNADLLSRGARSPVRGVLVPSDANPPAGVGTPSTAGPTAGPATGGGTTGGGTTGGGTAGGPTTTPQPGAEDPSSPVSGDAGATASASVPTTAGLDVLSQELAGEHAAVYAFALLAGRAKDDAQDRALRAYATHVRLRDELERTLRAAGVDPPVASPAYDVGPVPSTRAEVAALAGSVESSLASLAAQSVGVAEGSARAQAASRLVEAARRSATWTRRPTALPGEGVTRPPGGTGTTPPG